MATRLRANSLIHAGDGGAISGGGLELEEARVA
jgi:hypothetical protein